MKILLVTAFFPYSEVPHAGGKFIYEILKYISERHDVYLLSRLEPYQASHLEEIKPLCKDIHLLYFKNPSFKNPFRIPLIVSSYIRLSMKANKIIKDNDFDIVQVEHIETGLALRRQSTASFILDAHDVFSKPAMRRYRNSRNFFLKILNYFQWKATVRAEGIIIKKFDRIFTRSPQDKDIIYNANSYSGKVDVIPHPVTFESAADNQSVTRDTATLLFVGAMERDVNIDAVLFIYYKVFPIIQDKVKNLKFCIVGNQPPQRIKNIAIRDSRVTATGFVQSLLPYYKRATVAVTPLFVGGGIIAKNLEAMSNGVPVITTAIGNEGIGAVHGRDLLIAETPEEFAEAIIDLLKNPEKIQAIGDNGKEFVEKHFHIDSVFDRIDSIYNELNEEI